MGLRDREWRRFLSAPDPELLTALYEPALTEAVRYDRCCAYFSSTVLAAAARGFGPFVDRLLAFPPQDGKPAMRLLVNEELSKADVDAMLFSQGADSLADRLSRQLLAPRDAIESERLAMLGLLVQRKLLEVRVGVMRSGDGILHSKYGIVTDWLGDAIVFSGSGNESRSGLLSNQEELEVAGSWDDPDKYEYYSTKFESLWNGTNPYVEVLPLPEAVRQKLIRYADGHRSDPPETAPSPSPRANQEAWMRWRFAVEAPWFPDGARSCDALAPGTSLWAHQVRVVEEAASAWPAGRLLCDEVGMGKTVEAIMILRRLLAGRGVGRALLLVPAGIVNQWQGELREKGGLLVPRLEGQSTLVWPDGRPERLADLSEVLTRPIVLASREMMRLRQNAEVLLASPRWDLVLLDEAHAARRANQVETEFNSATLLLQLLRDLQLRGHARGVLLLSATPMQTHPWEPWDLLGVLGEGAPWMSDFGVVRRYYEALDGAEERPVPRSKGEVVAETVDRDVVFPALPVEVDQIPVRLQIGSMSERNGLVTALRDGAPLGRRMHRNTRATLREYYRQGLIDRPPAEREIHDVRYDFTSPLEREVYDGVQDYVNRRFAQLEEEKPGKGFVMTVYRRRAASSPRALERSLARRRAALRSVAEDRAAELTDELEALDRQDLDEMIGDDRIVRVHSSLPDDPHIARQELADVDRLLQRLQLLKGADTKLERFTEALIAATNDGRPALVFSEFTDTVEYLRDILTPRFGDGLACYTGDGGAVRQEGEWVKVSRVEITDRLANGKVRVLLCSDAASEGLNLQSASALVNYDLPWNPARIEQRIGRIDRIGQRATKLRIANLFLADSVDERVYQVLRQRCSLFETFVGAMQPVLSAAREMLLGVKPFSRDILTSAAREADQNTLTTATFRSDTKQPPIPRPAGVTIEDLSRAYDGLLAPRMAQLTGGRKAILGQGSLLAEDPDALPLSPFSGEVRELALGTDAARDPGLVPLVIENVVQGAFRVSVAVWVGGEGAEVVERSERLEALLGMWDGTVPPVAAWQEGCRIAKARAAEQLKVMIDHADREERAALVRQLDAAETRLKRELARFLECARDATEEWNDTFHRWMQKVGETGVLLRRAHERIGYPSWSTPERREASAHVGNLSEGGRKNLLLGTPLNAALQDPRWVVRETLTTLGGQ